MFYFTTNTSAIIGKWIMGFLVLAGLCVGQMQAGVKIVGANGTEVEFTAVFDARPDGLVVLVTPDSSAMTVPWNKIDLDALKASQAAIYTAYERAVATQKEQPLGMGIADTMLSLSQLPEALKQAIKDPYYWPYEGYSYQTIYTDVNGRTTVRTYRNVSVYPSGYVRTNTPFLVLKQMRDTQDDKQKKLLLGRLQSGYLNSYGINRMLERMDYVLGKIPPEKMFPRKTEQTVLIQMTSDFKKTMEDLLMAASLTAQHQVVIKRYFTQLGID